MLSINGVIGLLILLASIFAIIKIVKTRESTGTKVLWVVLILIFPLIGLIAWFFAGPGDKSFKL
ncbi:MAG: hypothetical protein GY694_11530 [Gammaproteobacteria bacterium]|nr:hypothetical protein [Gammaproteobacteria bacterium]